MKRPSAPRLRPHPALPLLSAVLVLAGCGQTGPLVLPKNSPPKQGYLLVDRAAPGTTVPLTAEEKNRAKATPVPSPTAPFPPQPVEPRSPLSTQTP